MSEEKTSLFTVAERFIDLLSKNTHRGFSITEICNELGVTKRRLYDVINVLTGVGLVTRDDKNLIRWIGGEAGNEMLRDEKIRLMKREQQLFRAIQILDDLSDQLENSELFNRCGYITRDELINNNRFKNYHLFSLAGPKSMTLDFDVNEKDYSCEVRCTTQDGVITFQDLSKSQF